MEELAKQIVNKMNLDEIINLIDSEIKKVDSDKKDELYSNIIEKMENRHNEKVQ